MKRLLVGLIAALITTAAGAVDPDEYETPPKPTQTSTECPDGTAWDKESERCVKLESHLFQDEDRFLAARELAYAGRLQAAGRALDTMADQMGSRVLTYRGFLARKSGDWTSAARYYQAALTANPDNLLALSYFGMGLAEKGDFDAARLQLVEIRARGGRETWPERALILSLRSGGLTAY